jgi:hypothetical protein
MIMKKVLFFAIMMMAVATAKAQFAPGTFSIQPKIGGSISWLSNTPNMPLGDVDGRNIELKKSPIIGALIGAEAEYQLADMFSLAAGVNFAMQGSGWKDYDEKIGDVKFDIKDTRMNLYYINVPFFSIIYFLS